MSIKSLLNKVLVKVISVLFNKIMKLVLNTKNIEFCSEFGVISLFSSGV